MYDLIYDFILNNLMDTTTGLYTTELATLLTHTSIVLIYIGIVNFTLWFFNVFRGIARF